MIILLLLLMPVAIADRQPEPTVFVEILHLVPATHIEIVAIEPAEVSLQPSGTKHLARNEAVRFSSNPDDAYNTWPQASELVITGTVLVHVVKPHTFERRVRGRLILSRGPEYIRDMLEVPLEQAVSEITAAEAGRDVPEAALAALCICVRSYLVSRAQGGRISLDGTTRTLLYRGMDGAFGTDGDLALTESEKAALATKGILLTTAGQVVPGYFHARCGGSTLTIADTFARQSETGQKVVATCPPCEGIDDTWEFELDADAFQQLFSAVEAEELTVQRTDSGAIIIPGGRPEQYSAEGFRLKICREYGWNSLRGTDWTVTFTGTHLLFSGRRHGHGVGLCMFGAFELARRGENWRAILRRYFPGTTLLPLESVKLP